MVLDNIVRVNDGGLDGLIFKDQRRTKDQEGIQLAPIEV